MVMDGSVDLLVLLQVINIAVLAAAPPILLSTDHSPVMSLHISLHSQEW